MSGRARRTIELGKQSTCASAAHIVPDIDRRIARGVHVPTLAEALAIPSEKPDEDEGEQGTILAA